MDRLTMLAEARAAGLSVWREGERLYVKGPKQAEEIAIRLIAEKEAVFQLLNPPPSRSSTLVTEEEWEIIEKDPFYIPRALRREPSQFSLRSGNLLLAERKEQ